MTVPSNVTAGDTWEWTRDLPEYPAGTWTLTYYFSKEGKQFSAAAVADGTEHSVTVPATDTATLPAGRYRWNARVVNGTAAKTVESGWLDVAANPATSKADPRSWARRTLEALECFLEGNASTAQQNMMINGRSITRWSLPELTQFRDKLRTEVRAEERGSAAGLGRDIKVRFGRG